MVTNYSKCGTDCASCPSYKDNLVTLEDRQKCSDGWKKYHGFRLHPERLIACDGCQPTSEGKNGTRYINCILRRCALENGFKTCAHCSIFPCEVFSNRVLGNEWLSKLRERMGQIPEEDYRVFVKPYLGKPNLDEIREGLNKGEIKMIKEKMINPRLQAFPDELESSPGYKELYNLFRKINPPVFGLSYAQSESHKEKRRNIMKILWAFGVSGIFDDEESSLQLDHVSFLSQKIHSSYDRIRGYFEYLAEHGLKPEIIPLWEDKWLTPTGALRKQGSRDKTPPWMIKMAADQSIGGRKILNALTIYANALHDEFGKNAFRRFGRADMQILWDH